MKFFTNRMLLIYSAGLYLFTTAALAVVLYGVNRLYRPAADHNYPPGSLLSRVLRDGHFLTRQRMEGREAGRHGGARAALYLYQRGVKGEMARTHRRRIPVHARTSFHAPLSLTWQEKTFAARPLAVSAVSAWRRENRSARAVYYTWRGNGPAVVDPVDDLLFDSVHLVSLADLPLWYRDGDYYYHQKDIEPLIEYAAGYGARHLILLEPESLSVRIRPLFDRPAAAIGVFTTPRRHFEPAITAALRAQKSVFALSTEVNINQHSFKPRRENFAVEYHVGPLDAQDEIEFMVPVDSFGHGGRFELPRPKGRFYQSASNAMLAAQALHLSRKIYSLLPETFEHLAGLVESEAVAANMKVKAAAFKQLTLAGYLKMKGRSLKFSLLPDSLKNDYQFKDNRYCLVPVVADDSFTCGQPADHNDRLYRKASEDTFEAIYKKKLEQNIQINEEIVWLKILQ